MFIASGTVPDWRFDEDRVQPDGTENEFKYYEPVGFTESGSRSEKETSAGQC